MKKLFLTRQIVETDRFAIEELKIPSIILMENAALYAYKAIIENLNKILRAKKTEFIVICGKGNNGGDGFALSRHLATNNYLVKTIYISNENLAHDSQINFNILNQLSKTLNNLSLHKYENINQLESSAEIPIYIDAMLGSGAKLPLKAPYNSIVEKINSLKGFKIAIDIPTGLDSDNGWTDLAFKANLTICLGSLKRGLFINQAREYCGKIIEGDIGIGNFYFDNLPSETFLIEKKDIKELLPIKSKIIHKYSSGRTAIIAGSKDYFGAAILCVKACEKSGAGAITLFVPDSLRLFYQNALPEIIVKGYPDNNEGYLISNSIDFLNHEINEKYDSIAIGCGLGRKIETMEAIDYLIKKFDNIPKVIDADAFYAIGKIGVKNFNLQNSILTPHLKEFSFLTNLHTQDILRNYFEIGFSFANENKTTLFLKGAPSVIFSYNKKAYVFPNGNPGMAKFGTGDVLAGLMCGLLAQFKDINSYDKYEKCSIAAGYLHNLAGDLCSQKLSEFSCFSDKIIEYLPYAFKDISNS